MTTHFPHGVTNREKSHALGSLHYPDPTRYVYYFDDFVTGMADIGAVDVAEPEVIPYDYLGENSGSIVLQAFNGGFYRFTTGAAADNITSLSSPQQPFKFDRDAWFSTSILAPTVDDSLLVAGLAIPNTPGSGEIDDLDRGIVFEREANGDLFLRVYNADLPVFEDLIGNWAQDDDSVGQISFFYAHDEKTLHYTFRAPEETVSRTQATDLSGIAVPTQTVQWIVGIQTLGTTPQVMDVDYIFASQERHAQ